MKQTTIALYYETHTTLSSKSETKLVQTDIASFIVITKVCHDTETYYSELSSNGTVTDNNITRRLSHTSSQKQT